MSYYLELEIPGLPKLTNAQFKSGHWARKKERDQWHKLINILTLKSRPPKPIVRYQLVLTRYSSSEPDYDGLTASFKPCIDGLVKAGVLQDDKLSNTGAWNCFWEKVPRNQGKIKIIVGERE